MNNTADNKYYIYAWYYVKTNEIFYIGKGCNNRYIDVVHSRNNYFKSIINKEGQNVSVKKLYENLSQDDAWNLEKKLIHEYWDKGECKANFHEGGRGGNHGNYNENMRKKLSNIAKTRVGEKNPMWHHVYTEEQMKRHAEASRGRHFKFSKEHNENLSKSLKKFSQSEKGKEFHKLIGLKLKGRKASEEEIQKNRDRQCPDNFICKLNNEILYETRYRKEMFKWIRENLGLSRTISYQLINKTWKPKFNKHKKFETLEIIIEKNKFKGVSTTPDECKEVE
jgi:hypothetical protein